jgi:hypothetical protein
MSRNLSPLANRSDGGAVLREPESRTTFFGLTSGEIYYFRVRAAGSLASGSWSDNADKSGESDSSRSLKSKRTIPDQERYIHYQCTHMARPNNVNRSRSLMVALIGAAFIILALVLLSLPHGVAPLKVSIIGRTNDSAGVTNVLLEITNSTKRILNYAFWVEVQKDGKWIRDKQWDPKVEGRLHWIRGQESERVQLRVPVEGAIWRFKIMGMKQPTTLEWRWLAVCRKLGLGGQPRRWYFYLDADQ